MKKNTNWKGGGAQRHKYLLLPDHGCRNRENAQKGKLAFSGAFAHTLDNETKYNESYNKHILQNTKSFNKIFQNIKIASATIAVEPLH